MSSSPLDEQEKTERLDVLRKHRLDTLEVELKQNLKRAVLNVGAATDEIGIAIDLALEIDRMPLIIKALKEVTAELEAAVTKT